MQVLELSFTPADERLAERPRHRERLLKYAASGELVMAGPWADDSGAQLIFDVDAARMDEIIAEDPYYSTPGVTVVGVRTWSPFVVPGAH